MDYILAKEIYGTVWMMDPFSFSQYSKILDFFQSGGNYEKPEIKGNSFGIIDQSQIFKASRINRMEVVPKGTIAQYNFDSVITKGGGMSHFGTKDIATQFVEMEANENVIGHIFKMESGGGSVAAIKYIREVSKKENRKKPLVVFAEDIMASAAMYIASDADYIIANSKDAMIGSIGTMIQLEGFKSGEEDKTGKRHLRIYASQSVNKNIEFEKAINEFDVSLIKETILDPHAAEFINDMVANRPNITANQKTGAIYRAEDTVGTLIDEIGSFDLAVSKIEELAEQKSNKETPSGDINNNQNLESMDLAKLRAEHPAVYQAAFAEGKTEGQNVERERVEAWAVYAEVNIEKVTAGIQSGKNMTAKDMAEMNLEIAKGQKLEAAKEDNAQETTPPVEAKTAEEIEAEKQKAEMDKLFGKEAE